MAVDISNAEFTGLTLAIAVVPFALSAEFESRLTVLLVQVPDGPPTVS
jgi:hypothetical protein